MKKHFIISIFMFLGAVASFGQTQKAFIKAAEEAYAKKNYYGALTWFNEALEFDTSDPALIMKSADAARQFQAYDLAAQKYKLLADSLGGDEYPSAPYYLAQMYQRMGKYEDAASYYNIYLSEYSGQDSLKTNLAKKDLLAVEFAKGKATEVDKSAELIQLESEVNTPFSEFGAIKRGEKLYFSTMRYPEKNPTNDPPRSVSKIHTFEDDVNMLLEGQINESDFLVANTTFSSKGDMLYYTVCEYISDDDVRCDLYKRPVMQDSTFGVAVKLASPMNIDSFTTTHPQISYDSLSRGDVLYFSSNRPGGKGGLDIYSVPILADGSYGAIKAEKELNTPGEDATPFYHTQSNTIYFSTDGRLGLGGYDVFYAERGKEKWGVPVLMKTPVNSSYHDLYYVLSEDSENAYFSSNRESSAYLDAAKKACCFDIYKVLYDEVILELEALVFDDFTKDELSGATLMMIDKLSGDTVHLVTNDEGNDFLFKLKRDREYTLIGKRPFYNEQSMTISTMGMTESKKIERKIYLKTDRMQVKVYTFNRRTQQELAGVQLAVRNLTTGKIDTIATNEIGNDFRLYLELGSKYEVEASKFGFVTETDIIDLTDIDSPGLIERKMYLEVFDIEDYMPVTIYFENDYPEPKSKSTLTNKIYGDLYSGYMEKQDEYVKKFSDKKPSGEKEAARAKIEKFFDSDVVGGYDKLKRFMRALKKELELGRELEIAIKGYTSPLADTRYNLALGQRRVSSVKNEILAYESGLFRQYVESGKLILTDISFGEETAPAEVSDNVRDKSASVFSDLASRERRVQIIRVTDQ